MAVVDVGTASSASLRVAFGQHSERGRKPLNQDFHGLRMPGAAERAAKGVVAAVADGIGSSAVSQVASQAAVRAVLEDYYATSDAWSVKRSMQCVLAATNSWLHAQTQRSAHRHDHERGHVCTIAVLVLKGRSAHLFHAGDTRIWRQQGRRLEPLTADHRVHVGGGQSYLSRALGFHPALDLDYRCVALEAGDLFAITSDGVHESLGLAAFTDTLAAAGDDLDGAARALAAQALACGSDDNLTVQLLRVDELPPADVAETRRQRAGLPLPPALAPRTEFEGFRIERALHASHRSHVWLATDLDSGRLAALKLPAVDLAADESALDRFVMEEWIARRVDNPHVLRPHVRERRPGHLYLATEYVEGVTLAQWLRDHPKPTLAQVRAFVEQIARGLQALHRLEILHQDLRPENLLVDASGTVRIIDFGSARVAGLAESETPPPQAEVPGTLAYTAPEYFVGDPGSERSDLYSLGVIAYRMLSGRLPYGADVSRLRTHAELRRLRYQPVRDDEHDIPAWIDHVLMKAVHPLPARRHEALSEFVHELYQPPRSYLARHQAPLIERHPVLFWKLLSLLLALAVLALVATRPAPTRSHDKENALTRPLTRAAA